jgi:hypothetical protein
VERADRAAGVTFRLELHGEGDPHVYAFDPNGVVLEFALPGLAGAGTAEHAAATLAEWLATSAAAVGGR